MPRRFRILTPLPGRTIGGVYAAQYGEGSVLRYSELIAGCATVLYRGRPALWVTHVYVDSEASVEGGLRWAGVPKQLARLQWEERGVAVSTAERFVCTLHAGRGVPLWRQRVRFAAAHRDARDPEHSVSIHGNEVTASLRLCRPSLSVPPGSPLEEIGLGATMLGARLEGMEALLGGAPWLPARTEPRGEV